MNEKQNKNLDKFEKKTFEEVTIWDWLGRVLPLTILAIISVLYLFELKSWLDLVIEISVIVFFIICFIWWYWAIYKIAAMVKFLRQSQQNFFELVKEFKMFKQDIKNAGKNEKDQ